MNLGVEKVVVWLPLEAPTEGAMWKRDKTMEGLEIVRTRMLEKVWGRDIPEGYRSDVVRLKIL